MRHKISINKGVARVYFLPRQLAELKHVNCMIVRIWEVACYARGETFTEAVASVASMVATPLITVVLRLYMHMVYS